MLLSSENRTKLPAFLLENIQSISGHGVVPITLVHLHLQTSFRCIGGYFQCFFVFPRVSMSFDKDTEDSVEIDQPFVVHLHSNALKECRYFVALLSNRWQASMDKKSENPLPISLNMPILIVTKSYFVIF